MHYVVKIKKGMEMITINIQIVATMKKGQKGGCN